MSNLKSAIDQLGIIKAQIAELEQRETELKAVLILNGVGAYEGDAFRATVSITEREILDQDACKEKLSPQFIRAHTRHVGITTVRVVARTGVGVKKAKELANA
jgi:hypothetical protein